VTLSCLSCACCLFLAEPVLLDGLLQAAVLGRVDVVAVPSGQTHICTASCSCQHFAVQSQCCWMASFKQQCWARVMWWLGHLTKKEKY
jgi:hypothetical protein